MNISTLSFRERIACVLGEEETERFFNNIEKINEFEDEEKELEGTVINPMLVKSKKRRHLMLVKG